MSVRTEVSETGIVTVCLARPDEGNLITPEMDAAILAAFAGVDSSTRAVVLKAEGRDFCVGRVSPMPARETQPTASDVRRTVADPVLHLYTTIRQAPVPVIALVQGKANGVGCALAAAADLVIAADGTSFCIPELDRNIPPLLVMTALHQRIHPKTLFQMVLSRAPLKAADSMAAGLAGLVVPRGDLDKAEAELVDKLSRNPPNVLRAIKAFAENTPEVTYAGSRSLAANLISVELAEAFRAPRT